MKLIWVIYIAGQLLHVLIRASYSIANKNNPIHTLGAYFKAYWAALSGRFFVETMMFWLWIGNPQFLMWIIHRFGFNMDVTLPLTPALAGIYGFSADVVLDYVTSKIPALKGQIPDAPNGNSH